MSAAASEKPAQPVAFYPIDSIARVVAGQAVYCSLSVHSGNIDVGEEIPFF
jgi:hypothetical protein